MPIDLTLNRDEGQQSSAMQSSEQHPEHASMDYSDVARMFDRASPGGGSGRSP